MTWSAAILDPRVTQALIAGAFVALGWVVNGRANRRRAAELRAKRVRDMQRAVFAEIRAYLAVLERDHLAEYGARIATRIEAEPDYFPVIPTEHNDAIFRALVSEIHVLPRDVIDPVVLYYSQINAIGAMIEDLRSLQKPQIGAMRAAAMYRDYIAMKLGAMELGEAALGAIRGNMDGRALSGRNGLNSPDAAPCAP